MNKILLIDSSKQEDPGFEKIIASLKSENLDFYRLSSRGEGSRVFFGPRIGNLLGFLVFIKTLPFLWVRFFIKILLLKGKYNIRTVALVNAREKLICLFICQFLGLNTVWFELPGKDYSRERGFLGLLLKIASKKARIAVFTSFAGELLVKRGFNKDNIVNVSLGVKITDHEHQDDIFSKMAREGSPVHQKHFAIGLVTCLDRRKRIEALFRALSICQNAIPNLQVIIIGEGKERKNLNWLAKKMELDRIVWFVGDQEYTRKWMEGFDMYLAIAENPRLADLNIVLEAMLCHLPTVAFDQEGFSDLILDDESGFFTDVEDSEELARKIMFLEHEGISRNRQGDKAERLVREKFNIKHQLEKLKVIMNYEDKS